MTPVDKPVVKPNTIVKVPMANEERGTIQITNNLIATIIKKYGLTVDGVVRLAPQGLLESLSGLLSRKNYDSSIEIELDEDGAVITLAIIAKIDANIPLLCSCIQDALFEKIVEITGYPVKKVNVNVIDLEEEVPEGEEIGEEIPLPIH